MSKKKITATKAIPLKCFPTDGWQKSRKRYRNIKTEVIRLIFHDKNKRLFDEDEIDDEVCFVLIRLVQ